MGTIHTTCHLGGHYWEYYPDAISVSQIFAALFEIRHPGVARTAWKGFWILAQKKLSSDKPTARRDYLLGSDYSHRS